MGCDAKREREKETIYGHALIHNFYTIHFMNIPPVFYWGAILMRVFWMYNLT
jgi:hypothetical protein